MSLDDIRKTIDDIDDRLLELLIERAGVIAKVAEAKAQEGRTLAYDPSREREVLDRLTAAAAPALPPAFVRSIFREVMSACLALQRPLHVAFLGPDGTFTHEAAIKLFGRAAKFREAVTIDGVFEAVLRGDASHGVVPFANSAEGSVTATVRALLRTGLKVQREIVFPIHQCLVSRAATLSEVARVCSHPQALGQCGGWLRRNLPEAALVQSPSTAAAVSLARENPTDAAIGGRHAAELEGMPILAASIQDEPDNATRFIVIAPEDAARTGSDATLVAFELVDGPGALRRVLEAFEVAGVNLAHIESHPARGKAWSYAFVAEMFGHRADPACAQALDELRIRAAGVHVLGSFPLQTPNAEVGSI